PRLCEVPPSPLREVVAAGLLRLRGVLFPRRGEGPAAEEGRQDADARRNGPVSLKAGPAEAVNTRTGAKVRPTGLGGKALDVGDAAPREKLADWMTDKDNLFFARALVNRYWKPFFGRGLVDPEDDMRATNPPTNPELLDALAADFVASG